MSQGKKRSSKRRSPATTGTGSAAAKAARARGLASPTRKARPRIPPPAPLLAFFIAGVLLDKALRLAVGPLAVMIPIGVVLIVAGLVLMNWATAAQRRAGTTEIAWRSSSALVTDGPFRFSRHPAYVGFLLWYLGASLFVNSVWPLGLLPFAVVAHHLLIVRPEEVLLRAQFGQSWDAYAARVRPWI